MSCEMYLINTEDVNKWLAVDKEENKQFLTDKGSVEFMTTVEDDEEETGTGK